MWSKGSVMTCPALCNFRFLWLFFCQQQVWKSDYLPSFCSCGFTDFDFFCQQSVKSFWLSVFGCFPGCYLSMQPADDGVPSLLIFQAKSSHFPSSHSLGHCFNPVNLLVTAVVASTASMLPESGRIIYAGSSFLHQIQFHKFPTKKACSRSKLVCKNHQVPTKCVLAQLCGWLGRDDLHPTETVN